MHSAGSAHKVISRSKRERNVLIVLLSIMCVTLLLSGCSFPAVLSGGTGQREQTADAAGRKLYYLSADQSSLVTENYMPEENQNLSDMGTESQIADVLDQLADTTRSAEYLAPIRNFSIENTSFTGSSLTVSVSDAYASLDGVTEALTRAAIVLSLSQIEGVDSVSFLCGGDALKDAEGNVIGAQTADSFINNSGKEITDYSRVQLHLFFSNANGDQLVDTYRNVVYNSNVPMERLVVEQVLKGPNSDTVYPTLNPQTTILSVTTRDNVCYVNFDQAFLTVPYNVTADVAIYSLVNSLTQLSSVQQVQITIDGDSTKNFMEVSLSVPFSQNLSVVEGYTGE